MIIWGSMRAHEVTSNAEQDLQRGVVFSRPLMSMLQAKQWLFVWMNWEAKCDGCMNSHLTSWRHGHGDVSNGGGLMLNWCGIDFWIDAGLIQASIPQQYRIDGGLILREWAQFAINAASMHSINTTTTHYQWCNNELNWSGDFDVPLNSSGFLMMR